MGSIGFILLIALMLATAGALIIGIVAMAKGGDFNQKYGNKMMVIRVSLQGATLLLLGILFLISQSKS
jgi:hypothetical protein